MTTIDIAIILVAAAATIYGLWHGAIHQLGSLAATVAAVLACRLFGDSLSMAANAGLFLAVFVVTMLLMRGLKLLSRFMLMGPLDRVLGAIVALFVWMTGLSLVLNVWCTIVPDTSLLDNSHLGRGIALETVMEMWPWLWGNISETTGVQSPL